MKQVEMKKISGHISMIDSLSFQEKKKHVLYDQDVFLEILQI